MNIGKSAAEKPETFRKSESQKCISRKYILRGAPICVIAIVGTLLFLFAYSFFMHSPVKSEECVDFCQLFDIKLTSGLEKLMQGEPETIVVVENKLKADVIVLCKSYSDVSYSRLIESGISDGTAKKIDVPYLTEGAYFYLLKDSVILCEGHTVNADLISNEIIAKLNEKIRLTVVPDPNAYVFQEIGVEAKTVPIESIHHAMLITDVE
jgi:hypothetical protein